MQAADGPSAGKALRLEAWQRDLLTAIDTEGKTTVCARMASQVGKTLLMTGVGVRAAIEGRGTILASDTERSTHDLRRRLDLVVAAPRIAPHFETPRSGPGARATWMNRETPAGGWISLAAAGSASQLSSRTCQVAIADELARWPAKVRSGEGSPFAMLRQRTVDWAEEARVLAISSPVRPLDGISMLHDDGDMRRPEYPCPSCSTMTPFIWEHVTGRRRGETPRIACVHCGSEHTEAARRRMLRQVRWVPQNPEPEDEDTISFSLSRLDSARTSLRSVCLGYRRAVRDQDRGDVRGVPAWVNLTLGRPREDGVDVDELLLLREEEPDHSPIVQVCAGVDVQGRGELVFVVAGFDAQNREVWVLDYGRVNGSPQADSTWNALESRISGTYAGGHRVSIASVDAGFATEDVRKQCAKRRLWLPTVGRDASAGGGKPIAKRIGPTKIATMSRASSNAWWHARLAAKAVHLPAAMTRDELTELAASEHIVAEGGALKWRAVEGRRNDWWDAVTLCVHSRFFRPIGATPGRVTPIRRSAVVR